MSTLLLESPALGPAPQPWRPAPASAPHKRRDGGRVFAVALILSLLLHAALFLTLRFRVGLIPSDAPARLPMAEPPLTHRMRVYTILPAGAPATPLPEAHGVVRPAAPGATAAPGTPTAPARRPAPIGETPAVRVAPTVTDVQPANAPAGAAAGTAGGTASVAERLQPRMGDPRLWIQADPPLDPPMDRDEVARQRVYQELAEYNAAMGEAAESARRATDWTVKGKNGERWGITPGKIHLGKITLPLPINLATPPGRRDEAEARQRNWDAIQGQRARAEGEQTIKDRIKAIRARKAAEKRDTTGTFR